MHRPLPLTAFTVAAFLAGRALAADPDDEDERSKQPLTEIVVTAQRLDVARARIEPSLGASSYTLSNEAVENRPSGEASGIGQILLQAPGVAQDGSGRFRVRAQANLQYRINNVILPEGVTDIGENLSTRLADRVELITGALPAQYGLQVGGIVNVTTKNGAYGEGGQIELYGGSHGEIEPAVEYAGSAGGTNIFLTARYFGSDTGLNSPDGSAAPAHDHTDQIDGFAFLDHILDDETRVSLILATSNDRFQLPYAASPLDAGGSQRSASDYAILSYQRTAAPFILQVSGFASYSTLSLHPDGGIDLPLGLGQTLASRDSAGGLQIEGVYDADSDHTLRVGLTAGWDHEKSDAGSFVLPLGAALAAPENIRDTSGEVRRKISAFLQDEWKPLDVLTVNAGLRFDHVNAAGSDGKLSPRINLVWTFAEGAKVHAGYARYFVPPPLDEIFGATPILAGTTGAPPTLRANTLRAESDDYYDIGIQRTGGGLTVGLDGYWRNATNLIDDVPVGAGALPRPFNYATGRVRGVELSATYAMGPISAWANLAVAEGQGRGIISNQFSFIAAELAFADRNFVRLSRDQTLTASAGVSYRWGAAQFSADLLYGGGMRRTAPGGAPNGAALPDYVQLDAAAVYRVQGLSGQPLDVRLDIVNLFDRRYVLRDGTSLGGGVPQWGPRRGVFAGIEQSF